MMPLYKIFANFIGYTVETFEVLPEVVAQDKLERLYQVSWNPKVKLLRSRKSLLRFFY